VNEKLRGKKVAGKKNEDEKGIGGGHALNCRNSMRLKALEKKPAHRGGDGKEKTSRTNLAKVRTRKGGAVGFAHRGGGSGQKINQDPGGKERN